MDILGDEALHLNARYWHELSHSLWQEHRLDYESLTGPDEVMDKYVGLARGVGIQSLVGVWRKLFDVPALGRCGFTFDSATAKALAASNMFESPLYQQEARLAEDVVGAAFSMIRFRAMSMMHYQEGFPGVFVMLLGRRQGDVDAGLKFCRGAWQGIMAFEERRFKSADVQALFSAVPYNQWVIVREVLAFLAEVDFAMVPPRVSGLVRSIFSGWGTSLPCELFFNRVRYGQSQQNVPKLCSGRRL